MDLAIVVVFALVYVAMALGGLPGLALDRTGVALLGAIAVVALGGCRSSELGRLSTCPPCTCSLR